MTKDRRTQAANARQLSQEHKKGTKMKNILLTSLAAGALASAALGLAGTATAAPSGPAPVDTTISQLQSHGVQVIVSRVDSAAVGQCTSARFALARRSRAPTPVCLEPTTTLSPQ